MDFRNHYHMFIIFLTFIGAGVGLEESRAATVEVDGVNVASLSAAVGMAQEADDGPHVINIKVDKLPTADGQVLISEPMTINGDADKNGVKCDILADVKSIQALPMGRAQKEKGYVEVQCSGRVEINDLKIHPNAAASDDEAEFVDAVRLLAPRRAEDHGQYVLNRVWASGSDGNKGDAFVELTTPADLYSQPEIKKWSGQDKRLAHGVIQLDKEKPQRKELKQLGSYDSTLTDCHAGLGRGPAINIAANNGQLLIIGGVFGHCGNSGIRVAGDTVSLKGSPNDRIVVLRTGHEPTTEDDGAVTALYDAQIELMNYVDAAAKENGKAFSMATSARVGSWDGCREIADVSTIFTAPVGNAVAGTSAVEWQSPTAAWAQSQAKQVSMLLFFYSPAVAQAQDFKKELETGREAREFLGKYSCALVDVSEAAGGKIAKDYKIFRVPSLLVIAPDAKSYKRVMPTADEPWKDIEAQLSAQ